LTSLHLPAHCQCWSWIILLPYPGYASQYFHQTIAMWSFWEV
jgi:hypothetical protein